MSTYPQKFNGEAHWVHRPPSYVADEKYIVARYFADKVMVIFQDEAHITMDIRSGGATYVVTLIRQEGRVYEGYTVMTSPTQDYNGRVAGQLLERDGRPGRGRVLAGCCSNGPFAAIKRGIDC